MVRNGRKRKKKRTRPRSGKQAGQRERDGAGEVPPTRVGGEGIEEAQNPVEMGSLLAVSTAVPAVPTLPSVGTSIDDSDPLQYLRAFVGGIADKVRGFVRRALFHPEDEANGTQEGFDLDEDGMEDKIIEKLNHILEIRAQALEAEDLERGERFGAAYARLSEYLRRL